MRWIITGIALCMLTGCTPSTLVSGYGALMRQANLMSPAPPRMHCDTLDLGGGFITTDCHY